MAESGHGMNRLCLVISGVRKYKFKIKCVSILLFQKKARYSLLSETLPEGT